MSKGTRIITDGPAEGELEEDQPERRMRSGVLVAASPKETELLMRLCLAKSIGGYNLDIPILNMKIPLDGYYSKLLGKNYICPDLYWPSERMAI